jgi:uncharacterized protein with NAD-binding domain and iron-sulfur cluster
MLLAFPLGMRWPEPEADHFLPSDIEAKNASSSVAINHSSFLTLMTSQYQQHPENTHTKIYYLSVDNKLIKKPTRPCSWFDDISDSDSPLFRGGGN